MATVNKPSTPTERSTVTLLAGDSSKAEVDAGWIKPFIPRLSSIGDYPEWLSKATPSIELLQKARKFTRFILLEQLINCLPNAEPFRGMDSPNAILNALRESWSFCIFYGPGRLQYLEREQICRYSCCKHCESVKSNLGSLVKLLGEGDGHNANVSLRAKLVDMMNRLDTYRLFQVIVSMPNKKAHHFELVHETVGVTGDPWDSTRSILSVISQSRASQARQWFQACKKDHHCRAPDSSFVPHRLLFVGNTHSPLRLIETSEIGGKEKPEFAALSYCWGRDGGTFKTTRDNIKRNKLGIRSEDLPQTIQDAIHICHELGLKYLWVDCLCIIQNDLRQQDWYEQSGQMRQIYTHAQLTITADDAPGSNDGFWNLYSHSWTRLEGGGAAERVDHFPSWVRSTDTITKDVLSTRGWALQERILSHRAMRFSAAGIRWECDQCSRGEDGKNNLDFLGLAFRAFRLFDSSQHHETLGCLKDEEEVSSTHLTEFLSSGSWRSIHYAWTSIVEAFSEKQLTDPRDRLSAISGLASFVLGYQGLTAESYLAGLWKEDLVEGLLWYVVGPKIPQRFSAYIAPSWSWASVQGTIKYFHERYQFSFEPSVEVRFARCTTTSAYDLTGRVTWGRICLWGSLIPVDLAVLPCSAYYRGEYKGTAGCASRTHLDQVVAVRHRCAAEELRQKAKWYEVLCDERMDQTSLCKDHKHNQLSLDSRWKLCRSCSSATPSFQTAYFCLSVGETIDSIYGGRRHWWLVLRQVTGEEDTYQRVGIGYFQYKRRDFWLFEFCRTKTLIALI